MIFCYFHCFFIPVAFDYARTGLVAKFPTLIACGFTLIAAIQSLFAGMELQNNVEKNRQDFEMRLIAAADEKKNKLDMSLTNR